MNKIQITGLSLQILNEENTLIWKTISQTELNSLNTCVGIKMSENEDFVEFDEEEEKEG